ncbi:MAG TPA: MFS transporter [Thermoanaerobaculia bacterium]|nr:MFS transporter [Thermoanaerobaculia bacterium]
MNDERRPPWFAPTLAAILYFSQGFPFGIVNELLPLYMRTQNVSLTQIGLISAVSSAWTWKFLWSPAVDRFGTYRRWMAGSLFVLVGTMIAFAIVPPQATGVFFAIVAVLAFASATQDIAIDATAVRITPLHQLGYVNSIRVTAYRGAMIVAGGALAALTTFVGWRGAFMTAAIITGLILVITMLVVPGMTSLAPRKQSPFAGVAKWLKRPHAPVFLAIAFIYRLGDAALVPMVKPFWVDKGFSTAEIGTVTTVIGISFLIAGAFTGGAFISRFGIWRALLVLGVLQVVSNAGYALAAASAASQPVFYAVVIIENFAGGLGTAAFLAFLMAICDREYAATHYALLSAAFAFTRFGIGSVSGLLAEGMGYTGYFWLTLVLGVPGLLLVPAIRGEKLLAPRRADIVAEA